MDQEDLKTYKPVETSKILTENNTPPNGRRVLGVKTLSIVFKVSLSLFTVHTQNSTAKSSALVIMKDLAVVKSNSN